MMKKYVLLFWTFVLTMVWCSQTATAQTRSTGASDLFPVWGITLGQTTWAQAESQGHQVEIWKNGPDRTVDVNDVSFWDHEGCGIFTSLYWTCHNADFPASWKAKGFSWQNSYNTWMNVLNRLGFTIKVTKQPQQREYSGRMTLSADVTAETADWKIDFDFDYGKDGYLTSSPSTLYSISMKAKKVASASTTTAPSSFNGLLPGAVTNTEVKMELGSMLMKPMGQIECNAFTDSRTAITNGLSSLYKVDDSSKGADYKYYVWASDNSALKAMSYQGLKLDHYFINIDQTGGFLSRRISYEFEVEKSDLGGRDPYAILDKIAQDFRRLGIPISYSRVNEKYTRANGEFKNGNLKYEIELTEYTSSWEYSIDVWIYNE